MKPKEDKFADFQEIKTTLAEHGLKATSQRLVIYQYLLKTEDHPSADRVHEKIGPGHPGISIATVYKTLDALVEAGLIKKVQTADGILRFDAKPGNHNHLYCSNTSQIIDFEDPELQLLLEGYFQRKRFKNFKMTDYQLQVNGQILDTDKRVKLKQSK